MVLAVIATFYALPNVLLRIPSVQRKVTVTVVEELRKHLNVEVKIDRVSVSFLSKIVLENLYLEDQSGEILLEAKHLSAGFNFFSIFRKKISFTTIRISNFNIQLTKDFPQSPLNLQFVIDAFFSKEPPPFSFRFNSILLRKGNICYDVLSEPETPGKMNKNHLNFSNISSRASVKVLAKDSLNLQVKRMSLYEESGFDINKLSFSLTGNKKETVFSDFQLHLPESNIEINHISFCYDHVEKMEEFSENAEIKVVVAPSIITLADLKAFYPKLKNFRNSLTLEADIDGVPNSPNLAQCRISLSDKLHFEGKMSVNGLIKSPTPYLYGKVDNMYITTAGIQDIANSFSDKPVQLPSAIDQLGVIRFDGEMSGFFDEMVAFGKLSSRLGVVRTDLLFGSNSDKNVKSYFKGVIHTQSFQLGNLLNNNDIGNLSCEVNIDFFKTANHPIQSTIQATVSELDFKKYKYQKLLLSGDFDGTKYSGKIGLNDPNAHLDAEGVFHYRRDASQFNFKAKIQNLDFEALNLTDKYPHSQFSFNLSADFEGSDFDKLFGVIEADNIRFTTEESGFVIGKIKIESTGDQNDHHLYLTSDILNGELTGSYHFRDFTAEMGEMLRDYIPSLLDERVVQKKLHNNNFSFRFDIENTEAITKTLNLPFGIIEKSAISGHYNSLYKKIFLTVDLPAFMIGKKVYEEGKLTIGNPDKSLEVDLSLSLYMPKRGLTHKVHIEAKGENDLLTTNLDWDVNAFSKYEANITATTRFYNSGNNAPVKTKTSIAPTEITLRGKQWQMSPTTILTNSGRVAVKGFSLAYENQRLAIEGAISNSENDSLHLKMNNLELENIFNIVGIPALTFGGIAVADLAASNAGGNFSVDGNLNVADFSYNEVKLGQLNMYSEWDHVMEGIRMMGTVYKNDSIYTDVSGHIFPIKNEISLYFNANELDASFIQPFIKNIVNKLEGSASGLVHLFGILDFPTIEGNAYVKNGYVSFDILNTGFTFNDSITLSPKTIELHQATLTDRYGQSGIIDGVIEHTSFRKFKFDATVNCNNLLVYNATPDQIPLISGEIFGTGTVHLQGGEDEPTNINVNMTSNRNTNVRLNFMDVQEFSESNFITYSQNKNLNFLIKKPVETIQRSGPINRYLKKEKETDLNVSFQISVTPEATIELLVDPQSGDAIVANGSGNIRLDFGNKKDVDIFGVYTVDRGSYHFSLQQLIRRNFKIREGSAVLFNGNPFATTLDVIATYNLMANINDLDDRLNMNRPSVPVNCVLKITGDLQSPTVGFDIELPNSDEDTQRQVMSIINSEDMMSRQIIYLLVLNKFYTPDYANVTNRSNDLAAAASATLSNQLSYLLGNMTDKVQIGVNIRTTDAAFTDTEAGLLLSSQLLNNRLLINGNFGYRDQTLNPRPSSFIGEFDMEYKLTRTGNFRLKAFNHSNNRYYLYNNNAAQNIQGAGVMLRKDFDTGRELIIPARRYRKLPAKKKNEEQSDTN